MLKPHFLSKTEFYEYKKAREKGELLGRCYVALTVTLGKMMVVASNLAL